MDKKKNFHNQEQMAQSLLQVQPNNMYNHQFTMPPQNNNNTMPHGFMQHSFSKGFNHLDHDSKFLTHGLSDSMKSVKEMQGSGLEQNSAQMQFTGKLNENVNEERRKFKKKPSLEIIRERRRNSEMGIKQIVLKQVKPKDPKKMTKNQTANSTKNKAKPPRIAKKTSLEPARKLTPEKTIVNRLPQKLNRVASASINRRDEPISKLKVSERKGKDVRVRPQTSKLRIQRPISSHFVKTEQDNVKSDGFNELCCPSSPITHDHRRNRLAMPMPSSLNQDERQARSQSLHMPNQFGAGQEPLAMNHPFLPTNLIANSGLPGQPSTNLQLHFYYGNYNNHNFNGAQDQKQQACQEPERNQLRSKSQKLSMGGRRTRQRAILRKLRRNRFQSESAEDSSSLFDFHRKRQLDSFDSQFTSEDEGSDLSPFSPVTVDSKLEKRLIVLNALENSKTPNVFTMAKERLIQSKSGQRNELSKYKDNLNPFPSENHDHSRVNKLIQNPQYQKLINLRSQLEIGMPVKEEMKVEPWKNTNSVQQQRKRQDKKTSLSPISMLENFQAAVKVYDKSSKNRFKLKKKQPGNRSISSNKRTKQSNIQDILKLGEMELERQHEETKNEIKKLVSSNPGLLTRADVMKLLMIPQSTPPDTSRTSNNVSIQQVVDKKVNLRVVEPRKNNFTVQHTNKSNQNEDEISLIEVGGHTPENKFDQNLQQDWNELRSLNIITPDESHSQISDNKDACKIDIQVQKEEQNVADKVQQAQMNQIQDNFAEAIVEHSARNQLQGSIISIYKSEQSNNSKTESDAKADKQHDPVRQIASQIKNSQTPIKNFGNLHDLNESQLIQSSVHTSHASSESEHSSRKLKTSLQFTPKLRSQHERILITQNSEEDKQSSTQGPQIRLQSANIDANCSNLLDSLPVRTVEVGTSPRSDQDQTQLMTEKATQMQFHELTQREELMIVSLETETHAKSIARKLSADLLAAVYENCLNIGIAHSDVTKAETAKVADVAPTTNTESKSQTENQKSMKLLELILMNQTEQNKLMQQQQLQIQSQQEALATIKSKLDKENVAKDISNVSSDSISEISSLLHLNQSPSILQAPKTTFSYAPDSARNLHTQNPSSLKSSDNQKLSNQSDCMIAKPKPKISVNFKKQTKPKVEFVDVDDDETEKDQDTRSKTNGSRNNETPFDLFAQINKHQNSKRMVFGVDGLDYLKEVLVPITNSIVHTQSVKIQRKAVLSNKRISLNQNFAPQSFEINDVRLLRKTQTKKHLSEINEELICQDKTNGDQIKVVKSSADKLFDLDFSDFQDQEMDFFEQNKQMLKQFAVIKTRKPSRQMITNQMSSFVNSLLQPNGLANRLARVAVQGFKIETPPLKQKVYIMDEQYTIKELLLSDDEDYDVSSPDKQNRGSLVPGQNYPRSRQNSTAQLNTKLQEFVDPKLVETLHSKMQKFKSHGDPIQIDPENQSQARRQSCIVIKQPFLELAPNSARSKLKGKEQKIRKFDGNEKEKHNNSSISQAINSIAPELLSYAKIQQSLAKSLKLQFERKKTLMSEKQYSTSEQMNDIEKNSPQNQSQTFKNQIDQDWLIMQKLQMLNLNELLNCEKDLIRKFKEQEFIQKPQMTVPNDTGRNLFTLKDYVTNIGSQILLRLKTLQAKRTEDSIQFKDQRLTKKFKALTCESEQPNEVNPIFYDQIKNLQNIIVYNKSVFSKFEEFQQFKKFSQEEEEKTKVKESFERRKQMRNKKGMIRSFSETHSPSTIASQTINNITLADICTTYNMNFDFLIRFKEIQLKDHIVKSSKQFAQKCIISQLKLVLDVKETIKIYVPGRYRRCNFSQSYIDSIVQRMTYKGLVKLNTHLLEILKAQKTMVDPESRQKQSHYYSVNLNAKKQLSFFTQAFYTNFWFLQRESVNREIQSAIFDDFKKPLTQNLIPNESYKRQCIRSLEKILDSCQTTQNSHEALNHEWHEGDFFSPQTKLEKRQSLLSNSTKNVSSQQRKEETTKSLKLNNMLWFINFHPPDEVWIHEEYMKALPIEVQTPVAFKSNKTKLMFQKPKMNFFECSRNFIKPYQKTAKKQKKVMFPFVLNDDFGYSTSIIENSYFILEPQLAREFQLSTDQESKAFSGAVIEKTVFIQNPKVSIMRKLQTEQSHLIQTVERDSISRHSSQFFLSGQKLQLGEMQQFQYGKRLAGKSTKILTFIENQDENPAPPQKVLVPRGKDSSQSLAFDGRFASNQSDVSNSIQQKEFKSDDSNKGQSSPKKVSVSPLKLSMSPIRLHKFTKLSEQVIREEEELNENGSQNSTTRKVDKKKFVTQLNLFPIKTSTETLKEKSTSKLSKIFRKNKSAEKQSSKPKLGEMKKNNPAPRDPLGQNERQTTLKNKDEKAVPDKKKVVKPTINVSMLKFNKSEDQKVIAIVPQQNEQTILKDLNTTTKLSPKNETCQTKLLPPKSSNQIAQKTDNQAFLRKTEKNNLKSIKSTVTPRMEKESDSFKSSSDIYSTSSYKSSNSVSNSLESPQIQRMKQHNISGEQNFLKLSDSFASEQQSETRKSANSERSGRKKDENFTVNDLDSSFHLEMSPMGRDFKQEFVTSNQSLSSKWGESSRYSSQSSVYSSSPISRRTTTNSNQIQDNLSVKSSFRGTETRNALKPPLNDRCKYQFFKSEREFIRSYKEQERKQRIYPIKLKKPQCMKIVKKNNTNLLFLQKVATYNEQTKTENEFINFGQRDRNFTNANKNQMFTIKPVFGQPSVLNRFEKERCRQGLNQRPEIEQIILTKDKCLKPMPHNKADQIRKIKDAESSQIKDVFEKVHQCNVPVVRDLIYRNLIEVDVRDQNGNTLLCTALQCGGNIELVELLLNNGANVNTQNDQGNSPLHYALAFEYQRISDLLIEMGADESLKNNNTRTPWEGL